MRREIAIVVFPGFQLLDAAGPIAVFEMAERFRPDGYAIGVLALGGGAVGTPAIRAALSESGVPVVLLRGAPATLLERVGDAAGRPLLAADPPARLAALAAERQPLYDSVATLSVDTAHRTPGQVAAHIAARLHDLGVPL